MSWNWKLLSVFFVLSVAFAATESQARGGGRACRQACESSCYAPCYPSTSSCSPSVSYYAPSYYGGCSVSSYSGYPRYSSPSVTYIVQDEFGNEYVVSGDSYRYNNGYPSSSQSRQSVAQPSPSRPSQSARPAPVVREESDLLTAPKRGNGRPSSKYSEDEVFRPGR